MGDDMPVTCRTTPITVHLTDEQMDFIERMWRDAGINRLVRDAVKAQRPRPIAVGDRVRRLHGTERLTVKCIEDGWAWTWLQGSPWGDYRLTSLTRVDDEAAS